MFKKFSFLIAIASIALSSNSFAQKHKEKKETFLDNIQYDVKVTEDNPKKQPKPQADEIKFKGGKLSSNMMEEKYKFEKAVFTFTVDSTDVDNKKIHFNCDMLNETNEELKWDGDVEEESIDGKILWMKKDKMKNDVIKKSFSFSGSLKKKK